MAPAFVDFSNTQVAFATKSDKELRRSHLLFRMMRITPLVKVGPKLVGAALRISLPISGVLKATIFRQFCGGETLKECLPTLNALKAAKIRTILDYAVEGGARGVDKENAVAEVLRTIEFAAQNPMVSFSVFKPSGLTSFQVLEKRDRGETLTHDEEAEFQAFRGRVDRLCQAAHAANVRIFIDAEESWIQDSIDQITYEMILKYNQERAIVFTTIQLYRHDRLQFFRDLIRRVQRQGKKLGVKLVRGAYLEKENARAAKLEVPSPIQATKEDTDRDYDAAIHLALVEAETVSFCVGTHNEQSSQLAARLMVERGMTPDDPRCEFAQLYGMGDHISFNLARSGYNASKYVPYGPIGEVMPYLFRRAEENNSIRGQTGRELTLITEELRRRGLKL